MKKDLRNAMTKKFQTMVNTPEEENSASVAEESTVMDQPELVHPTTPTTPEIPQNTPVTPVIQYVSPTAVPAGIPVAVVQQVQQEPAPQPAPVSVPVTQPVVAPTASTPVMKQPETAPTPLDPKEKSSGVLHIRLGELRSYVDFVIQSNKTTYQQYISDLILADYERNKESYLKYKAFMDQFRLGS